MRRLSPPALPEASVAATLTEAVTLRPCRKAARTTAAAFRGSFSPILTFVPARTARLTFLRASLRPPTFTDPLARNVPSSFTVAVTASLESR